MSEGNRRASKDGASARAGRGGVTAAESRVFIAFRFHVNFYHSYRGDSLDETGIGPDIRIIRGILDDLDALNADGVPVCGTWDIENYFSLEEYMPRHAPDLIDRIRARVERGADEVEVMSYNNGVTAAHNEAELDRAIRWAISNPKGSGLRDLFGSAAPVARPQECMTSPSHPAVYRRHGIEALSIYYSSLPFNGFSNFVPPLPVYERYNPLNLEGAGDPIILLPCFNHGDIADSGASLRRWISRLRRAQRRGRAGGDLLLLIDMDADDEFWQGIPIPLVPRLLPSFAGLSSLVRSVADLPAVAFTTPGRYLTEHAPVASISFGQDTADGSFDGFSSWAEKAENAEVWTKIHRSRVLWEAAELLWRTESRAAQDVRDVSVGVGAADEWPEPLSRALTSRLLSMSTTHFGLASPVMNVDRLAHAHRWADRAVSEAEEALTWAEGLSSNASGGTVGHDAGNAADDDRGDRGDRPGAAGRRLIFDPEIERLPAGRGSLVSVGGHVAGLLGGFRVPSAVRAGEPDVALPVARIALNPGSAVVSANDLGASERESAQLRPPRITGSRFARKLSTDQIRLRFGDGGAFEIETIGLPTVAVAPVWVRYSGTVRRGRVDETFRFSYPDNGAPRGVILSGAAPIVGKAELHWRRVVTLVPGLPVVYVDCELRYPRTPDCGFDRKKSRRLRRGWDARWQEVAPLEMTPFLATTADEPVRVVKHNFQGAVSSYRIDYHRFGRNRALASTNNHIADGWVAFAGPAGGLLVAQSAGAQTSFAFCPVRTKVSRGRQDVRLNPFGTYTGPQWRYPSARTGLGRRMAMLMADQLDSYAPSYAGKTTRFSLMIAPFAESAPEKPLQRDALIFATPPEFVR